jgi:hypothetical protein
MNEDASNGIFNEPTQQDSLTNVYSLIKPNCFYIARPHFSKNGRTYVTGSNVRSRPRFFAV